jgi:hypothetical protein
MFTGVSVQQKVERVEVKFPPGTPLAKVQRKLPASIAEEHGSGFEIESVDVEKGIAYAIRKGELTQINSSDDALIRTVNLPGKAKPSDGDKFAERLADQLGSGWEMTGFNPHLSTAVMTFMTPETSRARSAIAVALGVKPWGVQVTPRRDRGFDITLPHSYVPSKHDDKLDEVATTSVGKPGWYLVADAAKLTASIIPAEPPTFPPSIPYRFDTTLPPFDPANEKGWARIPLGAKLAAAGTPDGGVLSTDFVANPMMQLSGIAGSGKGVTLTALLAGALARGWQVCLVDAVKAGVDFADFMSSVRDGGWAENPREAVCVLKMAYEEGVHRKALIKKHGVQKWVQLPGELNLRPLLIVVDEATSLLFAEPVPKGVPKDNPLAIEIAERNLLKATALDLMGKIARELRFTGIVLCMASQVASSTAGIPTELRANLGAKILLGASPTDNNRRLALLAPDTVPKVPDNIKSDENGAARGVGVFEFEGTAPGVFKSFFSPPTEFAGWLEGLGVPKTSRPSPTEAELLRYTPSLEDTGPAQKPARAGTADNDYGYAQETDAEFLSGFDKANAARRALDVSAGTARPKKVEMTTGGPVTVTRKSPMNLYGSADDAGDD